MNQEKDDYFNALQNSMFPVRIKCHTEVKTLHQPFPSYIYSSFVTLSGSYVNQSSALIKCTRFTDKENG